MLIYSSTITSFLKKNQKRALEIMKTEMGLEVQTKKFLYGKHYYPLNLVVFESQNKWGYFWPEFFQIGIHRRFVTWPEQKTIDDLLRHELAHYYCYLLHGTNVDAHGPEFRNVCKGFGWDESVYSATAKLEETAKTEQQMNERERLMSKVQKLFNLAQGQDGHEAQAAIAKANELLLKYNLQDLNFQEKEEDICCQKVLLFKKRSAKTDAILQILNHFYVKTIYSQGQGLSSLEVVGNRSSVELADYTAKYLDQELERLWKLARKENPKTLQGLRARNSFFQGIAVGYVKKIKEGQPKDQSTTTALIKIQAQLEQQAALVYGRLSSLATQRRGDLSAHSAGVEQGRNLSLRPGVNKNKGPKLLGLF